LFENIIRDINLKESPDEIHALAFAILNYFGVSHTDVLSNKPVNLDLGTLSPIVSRLNKHEPLQYILNEAWFYGRKFFVSPSVLIPRPETELLVEEARRLISSEERWRFPLRGSGGRMLNILDIGTGSGCIAISLSLNFPEASVLGIDISPKALEVARKNAEDLKANVQFNKLDILNEQVIGQFDLILSNPPYISLDEKISVPKNVHDFEPHEALFAPESDPLIFYRAIAKVAKQSLNIGGTVLVEINERFGEEVTTIFSEAGLGEIQIVKDLKGKNRMVSGKLAS